MRITRTLLFCGMIAIAGCQTRPPEAPETAPEQKSRFAPAAYTSRIHVDESAYPNLFTPESTAVWVTRDAAAIKREADNENGVAADPFLEATAERIVSDYFIFECHIESAFPDTSIAYDAVGFRNFDIYLLTPDNQKTYPTQTIIGTHAAEEARGTLKLFSRTNLVVFPQRDLWLNSPTVSPKNRAVRLVIEAHNSTYYFEWPSAPATPGATEDTRRTPTAAELREIARTGFTEIFTQLRILGSHFR